MTRSLAASAANRYFINSWSARRGQRLNARIVDSAVALVVVLVVSIAGPHGRPFAQDLEIVALVTTIECAALTRWGATLGMRAVHLRVAVVDRGGLPSWLAACRRTVPVALCYPLFVPGLFSVMVMPWALLLSIMLSPLRRGFHDRLSGTIVVQQFAPRLITEDDLQTWWEPGSAVVMSPWGRVPDLYDRRRARAHRLDGAWWLAGLIAIATVASVGMTAVPLLWLWLTLVWITIAIIDETWWLTHYGATPGHEAFGYRVVDIATGQPPSQARAIFRSLALVPMLYLPPLQLVLGLWVHSSSLHRGPHDLIGRTIVVEPDYTPPSFAIPSYPMGYPRHLPTSGHQIGYAWVPLPYPGSPMPAQPFHPPFPLPPRPPGPSSMPPIPGPF